MSNKYGVHAVQIFLLGPVLQVLALKTEALSHCNWIRKINLGKVVRVTPSCQQRQLV